MILNQQQKQKTIIHTHEQNHNVQNLIWIYYIIAYLILYKSSWQDFFPAYAYNMPNV